MDIRTLNTFIQVAESGSFSRAAEQLGYSQPTVSVQIRQLEQVVNARLFDRIGHAAHLTDDGRAMLRYAQQICKLAQQMTHYTSEDTAPSGIIKLGMAESLCTPLLSAQLSEFRQQYPHICLEIVTAGTRELFQLLDHNVVDVVCTLDSHIYDTGYVIAAEAPVPVHFVTAVSNPLSKAPQLHMTQLLCEPFLLTEKGMSYRRILDEQLAQRSVAIHPVVVMGNADLLCSLVSQNLGLSLLPDYVTEDAVQKGLIVRLPVTDMQIDVWKQVLYRQEKWVSAPMQAVLEFFCKISLQQ